VRLRLRLAAVVAAARRIADGDLTVRLNPEGDDELAAIARALDAVTERFADTTSTMAEAAYGVSRSAGEVTAAVAEQTVSVDQQAAAITETTAAVEQLRAAAEHSAQRATQVAERASGAETAAVNGTDAVRAITDAMAELRARVDDVHGEISALAGHTAQIETITDTVARLADQSHLLALNAAIEAARAGEQGKSFAVVAEQVRALADQSKQATADIHGILAEIQSATGRVVGAAKAGTEAADGSISLVDRAGTAIAELATAAQDSARAAGEIASAATEQAAGMDQIATAMRETDDAVQRLTIGTRNAHDAAEQLSTIAAELVRTTTEAGRDALDIELLEVTAETARRLGERFERDIATGLIAEDALFDEIYVPIPGSAPEQFATRMLDYMERVLPEYQEPVLERYPAVGGACVHDRNGYRPYMNHAFSHPQGPDPAWNAKHARARGFVKDEAGLAASRNTKPHLLQAYRRTANGREELSKDVSVPIWVNGRHWGSFRTVYRSNGAS
jgi:methyl-accepting chemotaxis protein